MTDNPITALFDTSVVVDLPGLDAAALPREFAISALTLAELAAGPHTAPDEAERAERQERLQWVEANADVLPFDVASARVFGRIIASTVATGRSARRRTVDLMIASTAAANGLPLYTRNAADLAGLEGVVDVRSV